MITISKSKEAKNKFELKRQANEYSSSTWVLSSFELMSLFNSVKPLADKIQAQNKAKITKIIKLKMASKKKAEERRKINEEKNGIR